MRTRAICRRNVLLIALACVGLGILLKAIIRRGRYGLLIASVKVSLWVITLPLRLVTYIWQVLLVITCTVLFMRYLFEHVQSRQTVYVERRRQGEPISLKLAFPADGHNAFSESVTNKPQPFVFPESEKVEYEVDRLMKAILVNHIESWFSTISKRQVFPQTVERLLRHALISLKAKIEEADIINVLVRKAIPLLTQHLQDFVTAENRVRKLGSLPTGSDLEQDAIAQQYRQGMLHKAARHVKKDDPKAENLMQAYLREVVVKLLPSLLPPRDLGSEIVTTLTRELLAGAVLYPMLHLLSDPDFWNQLIVTHAHQAIQERARVKRFRNVLREQSRNPVTRKAEIKKKPLRTLERLMASNDPKDWDRLYRKIKKSQSIEDVTRMRREIMLLKNEMLAMEIQQDDGLARFRNDKRKRTDKYVIKAMSLLESKITSLSHASSIESMQVQTHLSFDRTLAVGVSYFLEFLERRQRVELLDFWHQVMAIKLSTCEAVPNSQLSVLDSEVHLSKAEIARLYRKFFTAPLLTITDDERTLVKNYVENEPDSYDIDSNEVIVRVARRAYKTMEVEDFPAFKVDPLYFNMVTGETSLSRSPLNRTWSSSILERNFTENAESIAGDLSDLESEYHHETMGMVETGETDVLTAMELALQDILVDREQAENSQSTRSSIDLERSPDLVSKALLTELVSAAPGDLEIAEQIAALDLEIREKTQSLKIIDRYIATKDKVDENESRVLQKSRAQLVTELEIKQNQKQRYEIQSDEHDLYRKTTLKIDSTAVQRDADGEYVVYLIEINRRNPDGTQAGWIIARRYSEFFELYNQLKSKFASVSSFDFPKKQLNRLKSVSESRRPVLESFLQSLLNDERICRTFEVRSFLSQHNEHVQKRRHRTVIENIIGITDPREGLVKLFTLLEGSEDRTENPDLREIHPAPYEDDVSSFTKPIVDFVLEAFDLRDRNKWIKKRAVVLVLQQLLGGTIESRIRDTVSAFLEDTQLAATISKLTANIETKSPAQVKSRVERQRLMELAQQTLKAYNPSYVPDGAGKKCFRALQNKTLNIHILAKIIDVLIDAIS